MASSNVWNVKDPHEKDLVLPEDNVQAVATLLEDETPKTCRAVWRALPVQSQLWRGIFSGNETFVELGGGSLVKVEPEN